MVFCTIIASDAEPRPDQRMLLSFIYLSHWRDRQLNALLFFVHANHPAWENCMPSGANVSWLHFNQRAKYTAPTYGVFNPKCIKVYEWPAGCGLSVRIDVPQSRGVAAATWAMGTPSLLWHLKGSSVLIQPITADVQILADMVLA